MRLKYGVGTVLNKFHCLPIPVSPGKDHLLNPKMFPDITRRGFISPKPAFP